MSQARHPHDEDDEPTRAQTQDTRVLRDLPQRPRKGSRRFAVSEDKLITVPKARAFTVPVLPAPEEVDAQQTGELSPPDRGLVTHETDDGEGPTAPQQPAARPLAPLAIPTDRDDDDAAAAPAVAKERSLLIEMDFDGEPEHADASEAEIIAAVKRRRRQAVPSKPLEPLRPRAQRPPHQTSARRRTTLPLVLIVALVAAAAAGIVALVL